MSLFSWSIRRWTYKDEGDVILEAVYRTNGGRTVAARGRVPFTWWEGFPFAASTAWNVVERALEKEVNDERP